jgi:hypothetical protein
MPNNPEKNVSEIETVDNAWNQAIADGKVDAAKVFAGETYATFHAKVKVSLDSRATLATLKIATDNAINDRNIADVASIPLCQMVMDSVGSDPAFGKNSDLYGAMGRKLKSQYASGLHRNKPSKPAPP